MNKFFLTLLYCLSTTSIALGSAGIQGSRSLKSQTLSELEQLPKALVRHQSELNRLNRSKQFRLDRYDLQLGLSSSGSIGVVGAGVGSAIEFVWQRNLPDGDAGDDIDENEGLEEIRSDSDYNVYVDDSTSQHDIEKILTQSFLALKESRSIPRRIRRRIIRRFKKDAVKIGRLVREIVYMPQVGDWYIGGFFKNYSFSTAFSAVGATLGADLRMRFRFKVRSQNGFQRPDAHLSSSQRYFRFPWGKRAELI